MSPKKKAYCRIKQHSQQERELAEVCRDLQPLLQFYMVGLSDLQATFRLT